MELRTQTYAFHPNVPQRILKLSPQVFALIRTPDRGKPVLAITNISNRRCELNIRQEVLGIDTLKWRNLIENTTTNTENGTLFLNLQPYDAAWMIPES
jgi:sucrose phosphorylase